MGTKPLRPLPPPPPKPDPRLTPQSIHSNMPYPIAPDDLPGWCCSDDYIKPKPETSYGTIGEALHLNWRYYAALWIVLSIIATIAAVYVMLQGKAF